MDGIGGLIAVVLVLFCIFVVIGVISGIVDIYNFITNESTETIETVSAKITHLDIEVLSPTDKKYYASVIHENLDNAMVIEITEVDYANLNVGDTITLQITTTHNTKFDDVIEYSIVNYGGTINE